MPFKQYEHVIVTNNFPLWYENSDPHRSREAGTRNCAFTGQHAQIGDTGYVASVAGDNIEVQFFDGRRGCSSRDCIA
jgi:hypothetical protein